jgi:hypothetical protein
MERVLFALLVVAAVSTLLVERSPAQSSSPKAAPARTQARKSSGPVVEGTLAQLMRGILFPDSNVIFAAQSHNPADVPPAKIRSAGRSRSLFRRARPRSIPATRRPRPGCP